MRWRGALRSREFRRARRPDRSQLRSRRCCRVWCKPPRRACLRQWRGRGTESRRLRRRDARPPAERLLYSVRPVAAFGALAAQRREAERRVVKLQRKHSASFSSSVEQKFTWIVNRGEMHIESQRL